MRQTTTWSDLDFWKGGDWKRIRKEIAKIQDTIAPSPKYIFRPLMATPLSSVRIVFLMPEPYTHPDVADGLALSCKPVFEPSGQFSLTQTPASFMGLVNAMSDHFLMMVHPETSDLTCWAKQGILLLNARPTTFIGHSNGHLKMGWEVLTKEILDVTYRNDPRTLYVLFGQQTQSYIDSLNVNANIINPPMPHGAMFRHYGMFEKIDTHIEESSQKRIKWAIKKV